MSNARLIQDRRVRNRHPEQGPAPPVRIYPEGTTRADVLFVVGNPPAPGWWETRGKLSTDLLDECGITSACVTCPSPAKLIELIEEWGVKVVINRALLIKSDTIELLAERYPAVKFVAANHSSFAFLIQTRREWNLHWGEFWRLAEERENCFLSIPDERNHAAQIRPDLAQRLLWIPNGSRLPPYAIRALGDPPLVSLVSAGRPMKNDANQLLGYALAFKHREMRLLISTRNEQDQLLQMCRALRIEARFEPWLEWQEYMDRLRTVDVCLQASFCESFNYVALEHMLCGVPVVGSDAIRYIPERWQAKTDTPADIARLILNHLENWEEHSDQALALAIGFAESQNHQFQRTIERLLE